MKAPTPLRRSRTTDALKTHVERVLPIRQSLLDKLCPVETYKRKALRIFCGPKPIGPARPSVFTEAEILEIRRMRDWHGMSVGKIAAVTGRPIGSLVGIVEYRTRADLDPGPRPAPVEGALPEPQLG